jgi:hypothetical protein
MAEDRGFLARWSARKRQVEADRPSPAPAEADAEVAALAEQEAANRAAAEAVDLDSLDAASDYTVFLKRGVPDALRRQALRKLWRSNPVLACLDGLNDYDENFADPSLNMAVFKSAWQVGKGYLTDDAPPVPAAPDTASPAVETEAEPAPAEIAETAPKPETEPAPAETRPGVSLRRRLGLDEA